MSAASHACIANPFKHVVFDAVLKMKDGSSEAFYYTGMHTADRCMVFQAVEGELTFPIAELREIDIEIMAECL